MSNPAFIVDGFTERNIIEKICPGRPIKRTDLNGKDVTITAIANKIASLINILNNKYYPIIVIIDKESRSESCEVIANNLKEHLKNKGLENQDIRINIADKMFENWLIADWSVLETKSPKPDDTDGKNGASLIRKELGSYHKTTDCLKLLEKFTPSVAYQYSPSFKNFVHSIKDLNCPFTKFEIGD